MPARNACLLLILTLAVEGLMAQSTIRYQDVSATHLPQAALSNSSMDARPVDLDGDGDLDLLVACEFCRNIVLINDGTGHFTDATSTWLPSVAHDSEDIGVGDFNTDGLPDVLFVSEDDQINELYLHTGQTFTDATSQLPVTGTTNAVLVHDLNGDGKADVLLGNAGQNALLIGDGQGFFADEATTRLPPNGAITQDLELGDIDGDGDLDLVEGNENGNRLLLNDGTGVFTDITATHLPLPAAGEETREADLGDIDGDGDLDLFLANVTFGQGKPAQNRLLINDGSGMFTDETTMHLPAELLNTVDGDFVDLNGDGHLDLVTANAFNGTFQLFLNTGTGMFTDQTAMLLEPIATGSGVDIEAADFNGDGLVDLYFTVFQGADKLYLGAIETAVERPEPDEDMGMHLYPNHPNPFHLTTRITYALAEVSPVSLTVYDVMGRAIRTLVHGQRIPGSHSVTWDGRNDQGEPVPAGLYLYQLSSTYQRTSGVAIRIQ